MQQHFFYSVAAYARLTADTANRSFLTPYLLSYPRPLDGIAIHERILLPSVLYSTPPKKLDHIRARVLGVSALSQAARDRRRSRECAMTVSALCRRSAMCGLLPQAEAERSQAAQETDYNQFAAIARWRSRGINDQAEWRPILWAGRAAFRVCFRVLSTFSQSRACVFQSLHSLWAWRCSDDAFGPLGGSG